jgi:hypothetical protein
VHVNQVYMYRMRSFPIAVSHNGKAMSILAPYNIIYFVLLTLWMAPLEMNADGNTVSQFSIAHFDICMQDLLAADRNSTDGYLTLQEYEVFVNARYYAECEKNIVVAQSMSQWEAFTVLACYSCLNDFDFVDTLPDCCLPFNNSRIDIQTATMYEIDTQWITRICTTADTAAVVDECYTAAPTVSPVVDHVPDIQNYNYFTQCEDDILAIDRDNNETDGFLSKIEFRSLMYRMVNQSCTITNDTMLIDAVYANLACASCYQTTPRKNGTQLPDLSCCTASNASISIVDIVNVVPEQRSVTQTSWIQRICTTASATIICAFDNNGNNDTVTMVPSKSLVPNTSNTTAPVTSLVNNNNNNTMASPPSMTPNLNTTTDRNRTTTNPAAPVATPTSPSPPILVPTSSGALVVVPPVDDGNSNTNSPPVMDGSTSSGGTTVAFRHRILNPFCILFILWHSCIY